MPEQFLPRRYNSRGKRLRQPHDLYTPKSPDHSIEGRVGFCWYDSYRMHWPVAFLRRCPHSSTTRHSWHLAYRITVLTTSSQDFRPICQQFKKDTWDVSACDRWFSARDNFDWLASVSQAISCMHLSPLVAFLPKKVWGF